MNEYTLAFYTCLAISQVWAANKNWKLATIWMAGAVVVLAVRAMEAA
jgi:hypothetical protein